MLTTRASCDSAKYSHSCVGWTAIALIGLKSFLRFFSFGFGLTIRSHRAPSGVHFKTRLSCPTLTKQVRAALTSGCEDVDDDGDGDGDDEEEEEEEEAEEEEEEEEEEGNEATLHTCHPSSN